MDKAQLEQLKKDIIAGAASEAEKAVTEKVTNAVLAKIVDRKDIFGGDNANSETKKMEAKQKAVDFVKALANKDFAKLKEMNTGTGSEGGYLVPEYFANEVVRVAGVYGVVRRNARLWPMSGKTEKVPTGGNVTAYRISESGKITTSQPSLGQVTLTVQQLAAMVPMTNQLLRDANINNIDYIIKLVGEALAKIEDQWGFLGLAGTEGIFRNTDVPVLTLGSGKTGFDDVTFDDLLDLVSLVASGALAGAKFYMHRTVFNALRKIKAATTGTYIFQEPGGGQPPTIWNYPVEIVDVMPGMADTAAATKFMAFGNLNYMLLGDRGDYEMKISEEATVTDVDGTTPINLFEQNMSAVRVIERVDIELAEADKAFAVCKTAAS